MKVVFIIVLLLHGLIHLLGFVKAYDLSPVPQLQLDISKSFGLLWLIAAIFFLQVILLILFGKSWWPFFAIAAAIISMALIIVSWQDAKYGTVINVLVLLAAIPALGDFHFQQMLKKEKAAFYAGLNSPAERKITREDLSGLPPVIQQWMERTGVVGKAPVSFVQLSQQGKMRTGPQEKWMDFTAEQVVDLNKASFIWSTRVKSTAGLFLTGRDKLVNGEGEMLIKFLSLIKVVDEGKQEKMNSGSMLRYLGEICWYPSAALHSYITWEEIGSDKAKAYLTIQGKTVSGIFTFSEKGDVLSFEALRFYGGGEDATEELWHIEALEYKTMHGYRIPVRNRVTWKLDSGDFTWLHLEITDINYSPMQGEHSPPGGEWAPIAAKFQSGKEEYYIVD